MKLVDTPLTSNLVTMTDNVMGLFECREDLSQFVESLHANCRDQVKVLAGAEGERSLQDLKQSVEGFLGAVLGDMESGMLKVYLQAVERGAIVFAIPADSENRDRIVDAAIRSGARHVVHFGQAVNESFERRTGDLPP